MMPARFASPRALLGAGAAAFGTVGVAALFLPAEFASVAGLPAGHDILFQLIAAGCLTIAALNWSGRGAVYGAIYGRAIVLADFAFGVVGGGSLVSAQVRGAVSASTWALTGLFVLHTVGFARLLFAAPDPPRSG